MRRNRSRGCLILLIAGVAAIFFVWLLRVPLLTFFANALVEDDGPRHAQAVLVLGGDNYGTRITRAAQLVRDGYAPFVVVSGPEEFGGHESDFTIPYAEKEGFPAAMFHPAPNDSDSTRTEVRFFGQYFRSQSINNILLVTSNYHTRRAASLMRKANPTLEVHVIPASDPFFSPDKWWKSRNGQRLFLLEWTKTLSAWMGN